MHIIKGTAAIEAAIASIQKRGHGLDVSIHVTGVSVMQHALDHGDTRLADRLVEALPKGARKLALVEWMLAFSQLMTLPAPEAKKTGRTFGLNREKLWELDEAQKTSWVTFKPEGEPSTAFDLQKATAALLTRMKAAKAKGEGSFELDADTKALLRALAE